MNTSIAVVICLAILAVVVLVALFRMGYVRATGSFWRASFELEAGNPRKRPPRP
jgi:HAMP domain-containing protein